MTLTLREPLKRILARLIRDALPDIAEAEARLQIAVDDGHFTQSEADTIRIALELEVAA